MGCGSCTMKTVLGFLGAVFSACALFLFGAAGYVIVTYNEFDQFMKYDLTVVPAVCAIVIGIIFFFAAIIGCCTMCSDNKCLLTMFGSFLFVLLALLVSASVLSLVYKGEILGAVMNETETTLAKFDGNDTYTDKQIKYVQHTLQCCGVHNYTDWQKTIHPWMDEHPGTVPGSCCKEDGKFCNWTMVAIPVNKENITQYIYETGCYHRLTDVFQYNGKIIAGALLGFSILLVLGIVCTCVLCCLKRQETVPYFSLN